MKWVEKTAKSVDEAVDLALKELGISRDKAEIVVIDEGAKGIFRDNWRASCKGKGDCKANT